MSLKRGYYDLFLRTCAKYPSKIAVRHYNNGMHNNYTYSELYGVCEYLTQNLLQLDCNKGTIGLISERNIIIPCVIAAAHKCCKTFMFIDPSQDVEAISDFVPLTTIVTIKTNDCTSSEQEDSGDTSEVFRRKPDKTITVFNLVIDFHCLDTISQDCKYMNEHSFIATTSGSTGEPKHIKVPIQCIQPNIDDLTEMFNITSEDIIYFSTPLTFDPSMVEILLACTNGASLLIAPEKVDALFPTNGKNSVTVWQTTPSKFFQFSNVDMKHKILSASSTLKILALGGEPLNGLKRLKELKDRENNTKIFSLYGVTEMSCWACAAEIDFTKALFDRELPLGNCLSETEVVIKPVKAHTNSGKIMLVSKTRQCFILSKSKGIEEQNSIKFVDTGDFGEIRNGTVYYRGRKDDVIKRFGNKVFLQLIESTIMQCPRVKTCSCVWIPKPMLLVAYFSSETLSSQELTDFLKCKLDDKHWPDKVVRVDSLPTNSHGKISKLLISRMFERSIAGPELTLNLDTLISTFLVELKVALCRNFTYEQIKDKDFFSIGGTSFLAVILCNKLSLTLPEFGKFILPYLLSQSHTIGEIIMMAQKEICIDDSKHKKRIKRRRSNADSFKTNSVNKKAHSESMSCSPVEFVLVWSHDTGKCVDASPTLYETGFNLYVTVGSHSGKIIVMDAIGGLLQGTISVKSRVEAQILCYRDSMMASRGIVGTHNGTVVCFSVEDCKECWRINIGSMVKSRAACCDRVVYVASYDGNVRCIDIADGTVIDTIHIADHPISADIVLAKKEYIIVGTLSGVCAGIHISTRIVAWRGALVSPVFASPVLYDNDKYVVFAEASGEIHCRTTEKGIKIWQYSGARGNVFSSFYIKEIETSKWQIIFGCFDNKLYSIMIKNFQPSLNWKTPMNSAIYSTPRGINDRFVLAASKNGKLHVVETTNGIVLGEFSLPAETFSSPAVYGDYIFIGCRNDHLMSLKCIWNV